MPGPNLLLTTQATDPAVPPAVGGTVYDFPGANGAAWPAAWTVRSTGGTYTQQSGRGKMAPGTAAANALAWTYLNAMTAGVAVDVTVPVLWEALDAGAYTAINAQATTAENTAGGLFSTYGYAAVVRPDVAGSVGLWRIPANGTITQVVADTAPGFTVAANAEYKLRFQAINGACKVKFWPSAASEPTSWLITYFDGAPLTTAGKISLRTINGSSGTITVPVHWGPLQVVDSWPNVGTAAGTWTFTGSAVGKQIPKATGAGAWTFAGAAVGRRMPKAAGSGAWSFTGVAAGKAPRNGIATGTWTFAGASSGKRTPKGTGDGAWSWTGAAMGAAPAVGVATGTASGAWSFTGTATGRTVRRGSASGSWAFTGAATGKRTPKAAGSGTWVYVGAAVGRAQRQGAATGAWVYVGTAIGESPAAQHLEHVYVYATLLDATGTAILAGNGTSTAVLTYSPARAELATVAASTATLHGDGISVAALAFDGTSTADLTDAIGTADLQTTT